MIKVVVEDSARMNHDAKCRISDPTSCTIAHNEHLSISRYMSIESLLLAGSLLGGLRKEVRDTISVKSHEMISYLGDLST